MPLGGRLPLRGRTLRHLLLENCLRLQAMTDCRTDRMTQPAAPIQQTTALSPLTSDQQGSVYLGHHLRLCLPRPSFAPQAFK